MRSYYCISKLRTLELHVIRELSEVANLSDFSMCDSDSFDKTVDGKKKSGRVIRGVFDIDFAGIVRPRALIFDHVLTG